MRKIEFEKLCKDLKITVNYLSEKEL